MLLAAMAGSALGADCRGNPNALGTSRTIVVDPKEHPLLGVHNYRESLPLNDHEVVLTFDDGPLPPYSNRILDILAEECVKATFFMVGRMATAYPRVVKRAYAEGHTIGNHSQNHPFTFARMPVDRAAIEIEQGFTSIRTALGDPNGVSDFFRIPGLLRQDAVEQYLTSKGYQTWSVDFLADDWTHIKPDEIVRRALNRIEARGKGILLLHDIHGATAAALPILLRELKERGYRIVHVVQARPDFPKTASLPEQWLARHEFPSIWPRAQMAGVSLADPVLLAPSVQNFGIADPAGVYTRGIPGPTGDRLRADDRNVPLPAMSLLPHSARLVALSSAESLPAPAAENFRYTVVWKPHNVALSVRKPLPKKKPPATASSATIKDTTGSITRSSSAPRPPKPTGHQLQLPPKPTAGLIETILR